MIRQTGFASGHTHIPSAPAYLLFPADPNPDYCTAPPMMDNGLAAGYLRNLTVWPVPGESS